MEFSDWLAGLAYPSAGVYVGLGQGTPGLDEQNLFRSGVGEISFSLGACGASADDGILLVNSLFNGDSDALCQANPGVGFTVHNRDNDLSGSAGIGDPNILSLREVVVAGEFVNTDLVERTPVRYDAQLVGPDPVSQGRDAQELINAATLADGGLGSAGNAGLAIEADQVAWQVDDQLPAAEYDSPIYSRYTAAHHSL